ncbi:MAG: DNA-binding protein [Lachnospiraceae bacterium]|nr:DNA-binding protein [Lachnospiraceae bacterium]
MKGYLTLAEAAEKWKVTPRLLSLYCNTGRIEGAERAGKLWLIPENAEKPIDKRVSSGKYIGWRERFKKPAEKKDA